MVYGCDLPSCEQTLVAAVHHQFICKEWGPHETSAFGILFNVQQEEAGLL